MPMMIFTLTLSVAQGLADAKMRTSYRYVYCENEKLTHCVNATERVNDLLYYGGFYFSNYFCFEKIVLFFFQITSIGD